MNIHELDSYNLADAVKFNSKLNPRIWQGEKMRPRVRETLLAIAEDFKQSLGLSDLEVKDITLSGSNAGFTYTPNSDIDLHLVVDIPQADSSEVYRELFDAKKYQYNDEHHIKIGGYDVELYVENANQPPVSQGMFSVLNNDWINIPKKQRSTVNDNAVKSKYELMRHKIESAIASRNFRQLSKTAARIKRMRQAGLDQHGELGPENLAYKMLRTQGLIEKLYAARTAARDRQLSLKEQPSRPRVTYGYRSDLTTEDAGETWDGVSPTTCMFLNETEPSPYTDTVNDFIADAAKYLEIQNLPTIELHSDPAWGEQTHSFGRYEPEPHILHVNLANRHIMDILRTTAHELVHCRQHELKALPDNAGDTGSPWENEAHAVAGVIMRNYADAHPEMFQDIREASGYIPTRAQAKDPRFVMALTGDVHPGQTGKEANKMSLHTDAQGRPALLMKTANLQESLAAEFAAFSEGKSYGYNSSPLSQVPGEREDELGNQEATGPEFPPEMPAGTTKIDVKDLTDWYQLGMDISDMDDADPKDYNQGPPQTVVVFPSDEAEQGYLKQFKRLGLKTHDLDPDVEGGEDLTGKHLQKELAKEFDLLEQEFLGEIKMTGKNLRAEAAKTGAIAGMEFEMIVPNVENDDDDDGDQEPDWDMDESVGSIDDACDFFENDGNNSPGDIRRLRENMQEEYWEWMGEQFDSRWQSDEEQFVYDYLKENASESELAEILGLDDDDTEKLETQGPTRQDWANATEKVVEEGYGNYWYDAARESAQEDFNQSGGDEMEWLEDRDINTMRDVMDTFGQVSWPYYTYPSNNNDGASIEDVANDFQDAIGRDVQASGAYHSGQVDRPSPSSHHYVVEPDGSLEGDDPGDRGLEFVSPPLPVDVILNDLNKVKRWAKSYGCYTNDSTGLHINVSVPNYSRENLDFVKLAILMGDEYVSKSFGRLGAYYAKSAMGMIRSNIRNNPNVAEQALAKMRTYLDTAANKIVQYDLNASKEIHPGVTQKFTSINVKDGHIEFRSPGGDWLDENFDKIENTLLRFTVALSAATNPEMYREEYLKKLYKLLNPEGLKDEYGDMVEEFAKYMTTLQGGGKEAAGKLSKETQQAIKDFRKAASQELKQQNLEKKQKKQKKEPGTGDQSQPKSLGGREYQIFDPYTQQAVVAFLAANDEEALARLAQYQRSHPDDPYKVRTANGVELVDLDMSMAAPRAQTSPTGQWIIVDGLNRELWRFHPAENTRAKANEIAALWARENNFDGNYQVEPAENSAQSTTPDQRQGGLVDVVPGSTTDLQQQRATPGSFTGAWRVLDADGNELYRFSGVGNNQSDANRVAVQWMRNNGYEHGTDMTVVPIMA